MKIFKKVIAVVSAAAILAAFSACNTSNPSESEPPSSVSSKSGGFGSTSKPSRPESSAIELTVSDIFKNEVIAYEQKIGEAKTGVMDFSWLNDVPAGTHGFVTVKDGDFCFEDGTSVKFWGVNLGFGAAAPEKETAEAISEELYRLGVNMVRLHALDAGLVDYSENTTQLFDEKFFDRMDYFIWLLKQRGIYIHLDLMCGKGYLPGDGFTAEEMDYFIKSAGGANDKTGLVKETRLFNDRCIELDKKYIEGILTHFNPYTEMRYCDDPVFAVVQYVNETSIFWTQQMISTPFEGELNEKYNEWLCEKYGDRAALELAWTDEKGVCILNADEDPEAGTVVGEGLGCWGERLVGWNSKLSTRLADYKEFLYDTEAKTFTEMYEFMRALGLKCPINLSNYPLGPADRKVNSLGDVTEKNAYWGDNDVSMTEAEPSSEYPRNTLVDLSCGCVADKPFVITEWNCLSTVEFKADGLFQTAAYAALQDWDGFLLFTWTFQSGATYFYSDAMTDLYSANMDPSTIGQFGMCAALFRLGLVSEAKNSVECVYTETDVFTQPSNYMAYQYSVPFISKFSYRFIDEKYDGNADFVITSGNSASGDYSSAKKLLLHSMNPYSDISKQNNARETWLKKYIENNAEIKKLGGAEFAVGENRVVCVAPEGAYYFGGSSVTSVVDASMKQLGIIGNDEGFVDGKIISDTKEIVFDYKNNGFFINTDKIDVFAGVTNGSAASGSFSLKTTNDKAAIAVIALDGDKIETSNSVFVYAMGRCANNARNIIGGDGSLQGVGRAPILYEDIRGTLTVSSEKSSAVAYALSSSGKRVNEIPVAEISGGFTLTLAGSCFYEIVFAD
ncbi:MAG: hypothetical protein J5874_02295 [Oscillospiraceae bacterium]|nr:hypothetical protein [Oscillospiraceae bacterium]